MIRTTLLILFMVCNSQTFAQCNYSRVLVHPWTNCGEAITHTSPVAPFFGVTPYDALRMDLPGAAQRSVRVWAWVPTDTAQCRTIYFIEPWRCDWAPFPSDF